MFRAHVDPTACVDYLQSPEERGDARGGTQPARICRLQGCVAGVA